jgi:hypothetical protein
VPGYPGHHGGVAEAEHPSVVLSRLLEELWNYWVYVGSGFCRGAQVLAGSLRGRVVERVILGLLVVDVREARCWVLRQYAWASVLWGWCVVSGV